MYKFEHDAKPMQMPMLSICTCLAGTLTHSPRQYLVDESRNCEDSSE